jgi:hypothetical protein
MNVVNDDLRRKIDETKQRQLEPSFELIEAVSNSGNGLVDLWEASPIRLDCNEPSTDEIINILFPGNPLLCCGWNHHHFDTRPRKHWHKLHDLQFIVPNPMKARRGLTKTQKLSAHALSNTGPRRFLIVEFDFAQGSTEEARLLRKLEAESRDILDLSAALLLHLAEMAPLALAIYSGGKSLHGWFYCAGVAEENVSRFCRYGAALGADPATWISSQFARMPDGLRDNGKRQSVYFFNPGVVK